MTESLQQLSQQGRFSRVLHADRDAGQVAAWVQRLKGIVDSFKVSHNRSNVEDGLCLSAAIAGKCSGDREQRGHDTERSRGASERVPVSVFVCGLNCVGSKCERKYKEGSRGSKALRA